MAAYFTGHTRRPKHPIKCFRYVPYALNSHLEVMDFSLIRHNYHLMNLTCFLEDDFCNEKQSHKLSAKANIRRRGISSNQDLPRKKEALQDLATC